MPDTLDRPWKRAVAPLAVFAVALALYAATLMPGVLGGDAGEMQFVPHILSLAHSPGYPLFVLLGKLWTTLVPLGTVAWRANLLTAVYGAGAAAVIALLVQSLTRNPWAGAVAGLTLAAGARFWELAVDGDKYTFNALLIALMLLCAQRWLATRTPGRLYALAFVSGLGLAHHRSILVLGPLFAVMVLAGDRTLLRRPRVLAGAAVCLLAPLLLYLYLPWAAARGLPPGTWQPSGLEGWYRYLADTGYTSQIYLSSATPATLAGYFAPSQFAELGVAGLILAVLGLLAAFYYHRGYGLLLAVAYALWAVMTASYQVYDENLRMWTFHLPNFVVAAAWAGFGAAAIGDLGRRAMRAVGPVPAALAALLPAALLLVPCAQLAETYPVLSALSGDTPRLDAWRQVIKFGRQGIRLAELSLPRLDPDPIVVADWEQSTVLWYYQQVEGWRPDMTVRYPMETIDDALATGRPVYLARTLPGAGERYALSMAGPLIAVLPAPATQVPPDVTPLGAVFSDTLALAAYRYELPVSQGGGVLPVTFYWQALADPPADYSISLRLLASDGSAVWSEDQQHPVLGAYPTHLWTPGQVVADYYEVPLPRELPAGEYRLALVLYTRTPDGGFVNLRAGAGEQVELPPFHAGR